MQARVRFDPVRRNPQRNTGESAFWPGPAQPSAEIVHVKGAKYRRDFVAGTALCEPQNLHVQSSWQAQHFENLDAQISWQAQHFVNLHVQISWQAQHLWSWKLRTGDFVTLGRGVSAELEAENWRLCCTTCTRSNLWSWKLRTGDFVVQL